MIALKVVAAPAVDTAILIALVDGEPQIIRYRTAAPGPVKARLCCVPCLAILLGPVAFLDRAHSNEDRSHRSASVRHGLHQFAYRHPRAPPSPAPSPGAVERG